MFVNCSYSLKMGFFDFILIGLMLLSLKPYNQSFSTTQKGSPDIVPSCAWVLRSWIDKRGIRPSVLTEDCHTVMKRLIFVSLDRLMSDHEESGEESETGKLLDLWYQLVCL